MMKTRIFMPAGLRPYYKNELRQAAESLAQGRWQVSWRHLERAHVLGQPYPVDHTYVHWRMLRFGLRIKDRKEVIGQIPRLLVGGLKSFIGVIPVGNTGGANVPALRPMEIPADLKAIIVRHGDETE